MKQYLSILLTLASSALLLASCAKVGTSGEGNDWAPLSFGANLKGILETKAQQKTTEVTEFTVAGFDSNGNQWFPKTDVNTSTTYPDYKWMSGKQYDFFGYANLPASGASASITKDGVTLTYSNLPSDANQEDALLGVFCGGSSNGQALMNFYHPLASVQFVFGGISDIKTITSIGLDGVYQSGSTTLDKDTVPLSDGNDFIWTGMTGSTSVSQTLTSCSEPFEPGASLGEPFIVIPQVLTEQSVTVNMDITLDDDSSLSLSAELSSGAFVAGRTTVCMIDYGEGVPDIRFYCIVDGWKGNDTATAVLNE